MFAITRIILDACNLEVYDLVICSYPVWDVNVLHRNQYTSKGSYPLEISYEEYTIECND